MFEIPGPRAFSSVLVLSLLFGCAAPGGAFGETAAAHRAVSPQWAQAWQEDLRFLARKLPEIHPDPFSSMPEATFREGIHRLIEDVPTLAHHQIVFELARLLAGIRDGHTRLTLPVPDTAGFFRGHATTPDPKIPGLLFRPLPIRLYQLGDDLFVWRIERRHGRAVGGRVLRIGDLSAREAMRAVAPAVHRDNPGQLALQLPDFLVLPEILHAAGVTSQIGPVEMAIELADGSEATLRLAAPGTAAAPSAEVDWATLVPRQAPLGFRDPSRHYWLEHLEEERALYVQYNTCYDEGDETFRTFTERLLSQMEARDAEKLILDLRWNRGGTNSLNPPLVRALIRSPRLREPGSLFVILGRGTFSAAMMLAVDLERHTPAIFVGEASGSTPNHHGDSRKTLLPETGLTARVSTLYWQYSHPQDRRRAISPHIPAPLALEALRRGEDPAIEAILPSEPSAPTGFPGTWDSYGDLFLTPFALSFQLSRDGDGWKGRVDGPEEGIEDHPLERIEVTDDRIEFGISGLGPEIRFSGRLQGDRIYGRFHAGASSSVAALLRRP